MQIVCMHYHCSITDQYPTGPKSQINEAKQCTHTLEFLNKMTISIDSVRMVLSVCVMLFQFKAFSVENGWHFPADNPPPQCAIGCFQFVSMRLLF